MGWRENTFRLYLLQASVQHRRECSFPDPHGSGLTVFELVRWAIPLNNAQMGCGYYFGL